MKRLLYSTVILIFVFNSCGKDHKDSKPSSIDTTYTIYYKNFVPDTVIELETISKLTLDLNNDSIMDLGFNQDWWIEWFGPHPKDCHYTWISSNDSLKFFAKNTCMLACPEPSDTTMYINVNDSIQTHNFSLEYESLSGECRCFASKKYVGFLLKKNGVKYLGWIQLNVTPSTITIYDFATLNSSTNSIRIGEH